MTLDPITGFDVFFYFVQNAKLESPKNARATPNVTLYPMIWIQRHFLF